MTSGADERTKTPSFGASPLVSVVVIAKERAECVGIEECLARQSCKDFELIAEIGGTIPEAWNRAISRARGRYVVFTETDARPLRDDWLEELVGQMAGDAVMVKGLEVNHTPWNLCNTIVRREALAGIAFDESFLVAEDTELFSRLSSLGYRLEKRPVAPVIHSFDPSSPKAVRRAFRYGLNWMRIRHRFHHPVEPVPFSWLFRRLLITVLQIMGMLVGWALLFGERRRRAASRPKRKDASAEMTSQSPH